MVRALGCVAVLGLLLGGCQGHLRDRLRPKEAVLASELQAYVPDQTLRTCLSDRLKADLSVWQLRQLADLARSGRRTGRVQLDPNGFAYVASLVTDPRVGAGVIRVGQACGVSLATARPGAPAMRPTIVADAPPPASALAAPGATSTAWVNLGAAASGQAIAVEGASIAPDAAGKRAWFRLTNPGQTGAGTVSYLLRIDCRARTINPLAFRQYGAAGAVATERDFGPTGEGALPVEAGTVMEIAYLALCT